MLLFGEILLFLEPHFANVKSYHRKLEKYDKMLNLLRIQNIDVQYVIRKYVIRVLKTYFCADPDNTQYAY